MTVSTSGKLPKLISGPLVNSPIDGGTESDLVEKKITKNTKGNNKKVKSVKRLKYDDDSIQDGGRQLDAVEKKTTKNNKGNKQTVKSSKRLKFDEDIIKGQIEAKDAINDPVTLKTDMERLEEAKMIKMEAHFRGKQNDNCTANTRKSYSPWGRESSDETLQRRHLVAARSRERLLNLRPAWDTTNAFLCHELVNTVRTELDHYQRLRDALGHQQETSSDHTYFDGVSPWARDRTNNSVAMETFRSHLHAWWLAANITDNNEATKQSDVNQF